MRWLAFLFVLLAASAWGQSAVDNAHARLELIAESAAPAAGQTLAIGVRFTPRPGWHSYWANPGDAGAPPRFAWGLPAGARIGAPKFPVPETLVVAGIMNYVYSAPATLLFELRLPAAAQAGTATPIAVTVDYLICSDELCVPERARLALPLTIGNGEPAAAQALRAARAALPATLRGEALFARTGDRWRLAVPVPGPSARAYFFPLTEGAIDMSAPQRVTRAGDRLMIETRAGTATRLRAISGVLRVERDTGPPIGLALTARAGAIPAVATAVVSLPREPGLSLPLALVLAIGGGLLLNVMPCVFPILSLKALALARARVDESVARREALAYSAGVLATVLALGGIIIAARGAGVSAGWAFQLQDSRVILLLLLLMTAIAFNLAGVFELSFAGTGAGQRLADSGGTRGAFWTGALAAIVATPCTGPFMGAALGAALLLPPLAGLAIFAGLGLGIALPFLALGFVPALRRLIPRPGPWMARFRHLLAVPMLLTALGLAWVLGRQAGVAGMTWGLAAALLLGVGLWWLGSRQRGGGSALPPLALAAASIAAIVPLAGVSAQSPAAIGTTLAATPFSEAALAAVRSAGRPAFVYFTADWCITCKVNEGGALGSPDVAAAFRAAGVATLVGDWTRGDPAITRFLEANGRSGVPLYLFYHADGRIEVLPQLLTVQRLTRLAA